ncbi:MAG TPA: hypothetical protein VGQ37_23610 [Vicinamibacterales bacterium]|jgi:hypothetical protein|nr:hypothetical protein [Vicinamibacterales bacterium]
MLQNWAPGVFAGQTLSPIAGLAQGLQPIQLLQTIPQQLQQLQQIEVVRQQQLQQIQQLVQYIAYQLQALSQHQLPQGSIFGAGPGQPYQPFGAGVPGTFSTPLQVM